ncbi:MAG TPA: F0F1 ATP synthase subunit B [Gemmatimonadaceae bacterium]|nr:F0F1 ATP synthase subunit B [Gemmatimonadaceae bacterium]
MTRLLSILALTFAALPAAAQEAAHEEPKRGLLDPHAGLMFWTLLIFVALWLLLRKFAFPAIFAAVEAREKALEDAIAGAKRDREEAAKLLEEHRRQIDAARADAQRLIADGAKAGEKIRAEMVEAARLQQQEILDRARQEIGAERDRAIAELRREAVELAIRGASKVIEQNLDDEANRKIVEDFLTDLQKAKR